MLIPATQYQANVPEEPRHAVVTICRFITGRRAKRLTLPTTRHDA
jgi:hypothetical protein